MLGPERQETLDLSYASEDELWFAYVRSLAEDGFPIPRVLGPPGTVFRIQFRIAGRDGLPCRARVLDRKVQSGALVRLEPTAAFDAFTAKRRAALKEGRAQPAAPGKRAFQRFDTCLAVEFRNYPELSVEYASNISRGGLFVRTSTPPVIGATVRLSVKLPNGENVETEAVVAHVLDPATAAERGMSPGVGLSLPATNTEFHGPFDRLIAEYQARRPRVLFAEQNPSIRAALCDALTTAGLDVATAGDGEDAFRALLEGLFQFDLLIADELLPKLDGRALVDRIRRIGGEHDLRIALLVRRLEGAAPAPGASAMFETQPPSEGFLRQLLALLGR